MCYSAEVWADYHHYVRKFNADIDINEFVRLYVDRQQGEKVKIPKGMDLGFSAPRTDGEREIQALIKAWDGQQTTALEQELFKQKKRLNDAERALQSRTTKKALDDQRIAGAKIVQIQARLADLRRADPSPRDQRIFPLSYAPVLLVEDGRKVVKPMRYQCRPEGKPIFYDTEYNGTYNARRDNLEKFWKGQFGRQHGLVVVARFYENVEDAHGRNTVLQFTPQGGELMLIACLWSHWVDPSGKTPDLWSFAAITDEPPPEVAAAGHDRCIINLKPENVDAWLNPDRADITALRTILDDRAQPYYEHLLAA